MTSHYQFSTCPESGNCYCLFSPPHLSLHLTHAAAHLLKTLKTILPCGPILKNKLIFPSVLHMTNIATIFKLRHSQLCVQVSGATQYVEFSAQSGAGGGVVSQSGGANAVRWEQGTCNARFKDQALKLGAGGHKEANGQKVESRLHTPLLDFLFLSLCIFYYSYLIVLESFQLA